MKFIKAMSYGDLFVKCIISSIILNVLFYLITLPFVSQTAYLILEVVQICFNLFLGLFIRKSNQDIFLQNQSKRKKLFNIILIVFILSLLIFIQSNLIPILYTDIILFIYNTTGIDRLLSTFDFVSIFICLGSVFFYSESLFCKKT